MKVCEETYRVPWLHPNATYDYDKILNLIEYGNAYIEFHKKDNVPPSKSFTIDPVNAYCKIVSIDDSGVEIVLKDDDKSIMTFVRGMLDSNAIYATRSAYVVDGKMRVAKVLLAYKDNKNRLKYI